MFLTDQELHKAILNGLNNYHALRHKDPLQESPLRNLIVTRVFVRQNSEQLSDPLAIGKAVRQLLEQSIENLKQEPSRDGELLELRFFKGRRIEDIAELFEQAVPTTWDHRRRGLNALVDIVKVMEDEARKEEANRIATLKAALPTPTYEQLFGFDDYLHQIEEGLNADGEEPDLPIVMTGLGGIGKTSLAICGISRWLDHKVPFIDHLLFVRIETAYVEKNQMMIVMEQIILSLGQQLRLSLCEVPNQKIQIRLLSEHLAVHPSLIVIDNIETDVEVLAICDFLKELGHVAQIVITSRYEFDELEMSPIILKELAPPMAQALLQAEAKRLRIASILTKQMTDEIFAQVGGHPLALKLIVAQLRKLPLERVLAGLERHSRIADKLYYHIYETSWQLLNEISHNILLGLVLLPPMGGSWEWLEIALKDSGIEASEYELEQAIQELSTLNLLQISANQPPLYSLHQLTYRFLAWKSGLLEPEG